MNMRSASVRLVWLLGGAMFVIAASIAALVIGPTAIPRTGVLTEALNRLTPFSIESDLSSQQKAIVWSLRLPRVALGALVGAALATSGATFQGVFRNPLADPYLLGIAAGGGLGATIAFVNDWGDGQGLFDAVQVCAFIGSLTAVAATWTIGVVGDKTRSSASLILAGVAVASFFTAVQTYFQQRSTDDIREIYNWFLGGLTTNGWNEPLQLLPVAALTIVILALSGRTLDVLAVGDDEAAMLGISVGRVRVILLVVASLLTASAVAVSGLISFVGLIIPHVVRLIFGSSFRIIVPMSVFFGAGFLVLCDLIARTAIPSVEIPIGVVSAFFGAPFFIFILRSSNVQ